MIIVRGPLSVVRAQSALVESTGGRRPCLNHPSRQLSGIGHRHRSSITSHRSAGHQVTKSGTTGLLTYGPVDLLTYGPMTGAVDR
jgi:hypothetical protein